MESRKNENISVKESAFKAYECIEKGRNSKDLIAFTKARILILNLVKSIENEDIKNDLSDKVVDIQAKIDVAKEKMNQPQSTFLSMFEDKVDVDAVVSSFHSALDSLFKDTLKALPKKEA